MFIIDPLQIRNIVEASNGQKMAAHRKWDRVRKYMNDWKLSKEVSTRTNKHTHTQHKTPWSHLYSQTIVEISELLIVSYRTCMLVYYNDSRLCPSYIFLH